MQFYMFLADGFEEIEGLTVVDLLRRADINIKTVSIMGRKQVMGSHKIKIEADALYEECDFKDSLGVILPGGLPGTNYLMEHGGVKQQLEECSRNGKYLCAICAAPSVLGKYGYLNGKHAICYPGFEGKLTGAVIEANEKVVKDGNVITGRGMGAAFEFGFEIIEAVKGKETRRNLERGVQFLIE